MTPEAFFAHLKKENEQAPGTHILEPGLTDADLSWWQKQYRHQPLPDDFICLLRVHNGFCLHTDEYTSMGAIRLFRIREIKPASQRMYGERRSPRVPKTWLAITDHPDSARYLILDSATGHYLDVNPIVLDEAEVVARNVGELLDWVDTIVQRWLA